MKSLRFAHVALNCRSLAATELFYAKHFGFRRARVIDLGKEQIIFLKRGEMYLELFQAKGDAPSPPPSNDGDTWPGVRHIAFQVENVDAALNELGSEVPVSFGPFAFDAFIPGWKTVWVKDPDGNIVEISQGFKDEMPVPTPIEAPVALAAR